MRAWNDGQNYTDGAIISTYPDFLPANHISGQIVVARKGRLKGLRARILTAVGVVTTFQIFKNNVATPIIAVVAIGATSASDLVNKTEVTAGDKIEARITDNAPLDANIVRSSLGFLPSCASCREQGYGDTLEWGAQAAPSA